MTEAISIDVKSLSIRSSFVSIVSASAKLCESADFLSCRKLSAILIVNLPILKGNSSLSAPIISRPSREARS